MNLVNVLASLTLLDVFSWVVLGFLVGVAVHFLDRREGNRDVVGTTLAGILGALVGGLFARFVLGSGVGFSLAALMVALGVGLILSGVERLISRRKEKNSEEMQEDLVYYSQVTPTRHEDLEMNDRLDLIKREKERREKEAIKNVVDPIQMGEFLRWVEYPATKEKLIKVAYDRGADRDVLYTLGQLPDKQYFSPREISVEIVSL